MEESLSSHLIRKGAWKCKAVELQMDKFAKQNRQRMRRLENMQRHADQQAEKQMRAEKLWDNILKRGENAQRRLQHNRKIAWSQQTLKNKSNNISQHPQLQICALALNLRGADTCDFLP